MHCKECDVWVNSETQMKQHLGSLRHKNTIAGIPVPPRPDKVEPVKPRSNHQYKCELCNVTLNSEVQLLQHLRSQRHKATLEGKPPKPRWVPYERFREQQRIQAKLVSIDIIMGAELFLISYLTVESSFFRPTLTVYFRKFKLQPTQMHHISQLFSLK